jgi:hypothetical protein
LETDHLFQARTHVFFDPQISAASLTSFEFHISTWFAFRLWLTIGAWFRRREWHIRGRELIPFPSPPGPGSRSNRSTGRPDPLRFGLPGAGATNHSHSAGPLQVYIHRVLPRSFSAEGLTHVLTPKQRGAAAWALAISNCLRRELSLHPRCGVCSILMGPGHTEAGIGQFCVVKVRTGRPLGTERPISCGRA